MNAGEKYYCSRCMRELKEEGVCPHCGYDPSEEQPNYLLMEGTLLQNGRYELGVVIGRGGFGITYAAWDLVLDIPVAIKEYYPESYCDRDNSESDIVIPRQEYQSYYQLGLQTFIREARILASLQNIPSVVNVFGCFEKNRTAYIVMEFVRGETLFSYCKKKKLNEKKLLKMLRQSIDDLILVHKAGVLHRDISPMNLLVQEDGVVKLIDFGAAISIATDEDSGFSFNRSFAAPEQYDVHGKQGFWTDVYGLSATIYTLLTGSVIQDAPSRLESDHLKKNYKTVTRISRKLRNSIFNGLILDTSKRTQTMEDFRADLYHLPRPIVTRKQRIRMIVKILAAALGIELAIAGLLEAISEKTLSQVIDAAQCYIANDTECAFYLAENYRTGKSGDAGYKWNISKSLYWYQWAADHGNIEAMFAYALILQEGKLTERNIPLAISYYEKAAGPDAPMAWNNLGVIYMEGKGIPKDLDKAFSCFREAEKYGVTLALSNLGYFYEQGETVGEDMSKAVEYYQKSADNGDAYGMYRLALCYGEGKGIEQSNLQCLRYLYEAAEKECPEAMCEIGHLYETGDFGFTDYDMAMMWYEKAIELGFGGGCYMEALMYRDGVGVEADENIASDLMQWAADWEFEPAYEELRKMEKNGYGIFGDEAFREQ